MARNVDVINEALDQIENQLALVEHHLREDLKEMSGPSRVRLYDQSILFSQTYGETKGGEIDFEWMRKDPAVVERFDMFLSFLTDSAHLSITTGVYLNTEAVARLIQRTH